MNANQELTKARFNAACINANSVPFARLTPKCCRRVCSRAITPSHTNITCSTACAPLGPAAPTTVHYRPCIQDGNKSQQNSAKNIYIYISFLKCYTLCTFKLGQNERMEMDRNDRGASEYRTDKIKRRTASRNS